MLRCRGAVDAHELDSRARQCSVSDLEMPRVVRIAGVQGDCVNVEKRSDTRPPVRAYECVGRRHDLGLHCEIVARLEPLHRIDDPRARRSPLLVLVRRVGIREHDDGGASATRSTSLARKARVASLAGSTSLKYALTAM